MDQSVEEKIVEINKENNSAESNFVDVINDNEQENVELEVKKTSPEEPHNMTLMIIMILMMTFQNHYLMRIFQIYLNLRIGKKMMEFHYLIAIDLTPLRKKMIQILN